MSMPNLSKREMYAKADRYFLLLFVLFLTTIILVSIRIYFFFTFVKWWEYLLFIGYCVMIIFLFFTYIYASFSAELDYRIHIPYTEQAWDLTGIENTEKVQRIITHMHSKNQIQHLLLIDASTSIKKLQTDIHKLSDIIYRIDTRLQDLQKSSHTRFHTKKVIKK